MIYNRSRSVVLLGISILTMMSSSITFADILLAEVLKNIEKAEYISVPSQAFAEFASEVYGKGSFNDPDVIRLTSAFAICTSKKFKNVYGYKVKKVNYEVSGVLPHQVQLQKFKSLPIGKEPLVRAKWYQNRWNNAEVINGGTFWKLGWEEREYDYATIEIGEPFPNEIFTSLFCFGDEDHVNNKQNKSRYENVLHYLDRSENVGKVEGQEPLELTYPGFWGLTIVTPYQP